MRGRHRRPGGISNRGHGCFQVSAAQLTIMILFGSLGVIFVLLSQTLTRPTGRRRQT